MLVDLFQVPTWPMGYFHNLLILFLALHTLFLMPLAGLVIIFLPNGCSVMMLNTNRGRGGLSIVRKLGSPRTRAYTLYTLTRMHCLIGKFHDIFHPYSFCEDIHKKLFPRRYKKQCLRSAVQW